MSLTITTRTPVATRFNSPTSKGTSCVGCKPAQLNSHRHVDPRTRNWSSAGRWF